MIGSLHDGRNRIITRSNKAVIRRNSGVGTHMENPQCRRLHAKTMETPSHLSEKKNKITQFERQVSKLNFDCFQSSNTSEYQSLQLSVPYGLART